MKLTGKEIVSLHAEKNGEYYFGIYEKSLNKLLNVYLLDKYCMQLIKNNKTGKLVTNYLKINEMKIAKGTKVSVKFRISLRKSIPLLKNTKYIATCPRLDISEFYNHVIELFDLWAYELNTVIDNIKLELIELEILEEEK